MATIRVDRQAIAEGFTQKSKIARTQDDVVGVVHNGNLGAVLQVILKRIQAGLIDQLQRLPPSVRARHIGIT